MLKIYYFIYTSSLAIPLQLPLRSKNRPGICYLLLSTTASGKNVVKEIEAGDINIVLIDWWRYNRVKVDETKTLSIYTQLGFEVISLSCHHVMQTHSMKAPPFLSIWPSTFLFFIFLILIIYETVMRVLWKSRNQAPQRVLFFKYIFLFWVFFFKSNRSCLSTCLRV